MLILKYRWELARARETEAQREGEGSPSAAVGQVRSVPRHPQGAREGTRRGAGTRALSCIRRNKHCQSSKINTGLKN